MHLVRIYEGGRLVRGREVRGPCGLGPPTSGATAVTTFGRVPRDHEPGTTSQRTQVRAPEPATTSPKSRDGNHETERA